MKVISKKQSGKFRYKLTENYYVQELHQSNERIKHRTLNNKLIVSTRVLLEILNPVNLTGAQLPNK